MPVQSMTGFARHEAETADGAFFWELRSVNGKGLDLRLRLPQGLEGLEARLRRIAADRLGRGNIQASLQYRRSEALPQFVLNEPMLAQILALSGRLVAEGHAAPPSADGLLAIKGILDLAEPDVGPRDAGEQDRALVEGFEAALDGLVAARQSEGAAIARVVAERIDAIERLTRAAQDDPARSPGAIAERLLRQVGDLLKTDAGLDERRLHQEAALLATKADILEELDRLRAHLEAARRLLDEGGPIGRRFEFLAQEFNRESNTICSKSNAVSLTAIGLELKVVVDQLREQVQNLE